MNLPPTNRSGKDVLDAYFHAASGSELESALEQIRLFVRPVLAGSIRAKLNVSLRNGDNSHTNQDALDLAAETELLLFRRLDKLKREGEYGRIENFEGYVRQVAQNTFNQYLRSRHPVRSSLRNQIRYILTHDPELSIEASEDGSLICRSTTQGVYAADRRGAPRDQVIGLPLPGLVRDAIESSDEPLSLEQLVSVVFERQGLSERHHVDEEVALGLEGIAAAQQSSVENREMLVSIWEEIMRMPLMHRRALLLNLTDRSGESLIQEIPILRVASIRTIAQTLEIPYEAFAELWNKLPIDDKRIAQQFGLTRQQVINLRQSARARLKRRLIERVDKRKD